MIDHTERTVAQNLTMEDVYVQAVERIDSLRTLLKGDAHSIVECKNEFAEVRMCLGALPLDTDEFGLAGNRLRNAAQYLEDGERAAACYELQLLSRNLSRSQSHGMPVRRRRIMTH
jgi:hypothetical protein